MRKEDEMLDKVKEFLIDNYNNTNWDNVTEDYRMLSQMYTGSTFWQELLLLALDQLERKCNYERRKANEKGMHKSSMDR